MVYIKEDLYKKDLHDPDHHDGVITHLEPDILKCEVKWALERITTNKASGGDGIPVELPGDVSLSIFWEIVKGREAWHAAFHEVIKIWTQLSN